MPWNILLFPLLGGFICLDWCFLTRLRNQRIEGNRLLLEAAFTGLVLVVLAHGVVRFCEFYNIGHEVARFWASAAPPNVLYLGTGFLALCLGPSVAFLLNVTLDKDFAKQKAIQRVGDYVLGLLYEAASRFELVQVVLDTNEVYVGLVSVAPDLRPENQVVLIPVVEGSRDGNTLEIKYREKRTAWTYEWPTDERRWAEVVVPLDSVKSVRRVKSLRDLQQRTA